MNMKVIFASFAFVYVEIGPDLPVGDPPGDSVFPFEIQQKQLKVPSPVDFMFLLGNRLRTI